MFEKPSICCYLLFLFALLVLFCSGEWIIAEITTSIRCERLGDKGLEIHLTKKEWREKRSDLDFSQLSAKSFNDTYESAYENDKAKSYPKILTFKGRNYHLWAIYPKFNIANYSDDTKLHHQFAEWHFIYYDNKIKMPIASSTDVSGTYFNILSFDAPNKRIECTGKKDNYSLMKDLISDYFN